MKFTDDSDTMRNAESLSAAAYYLLCQVLQKML